MTQEVIVPNSAIRLKASLQIYTPPASPFPLQAENKSTKQPAAFLASDLGKYEPQLAWYPDLGYGYFPVDEYTFQYRHTAPDAVYDESYFNKYATYENTGIGHAINTARVELVGQYVGDAPVLDVGIGSGTFVRSLAHGFGFDVNPAGVKWLQANKKFLPMYDQVALYTHNITAFTFWDSLEHIQDLNRVWKVLPLWVFVSVPVFENLEHLQSSKHYRKDEHFHYFTHSAFIRTFENLGYQLIERNDMETKLGRADIGTYVFKKG